MFSFNYLLYIAIIYFYISKLLNNFFVPNNQFCEHRVVFFKTNSISITQSRYNMISTLIFHVLNERNFHRDLIHDFYNNSRTFTVSSHKLVYRYIHKIMSECFFLKHLLFQNRVRSVREFWKVFLRSIRFSCPLEINVRLYVPRKTLLSKPNSDLKQDGVKTQT